MKIVLLACISCLMFSCTQAAGTCVRPGRNSNYEVDEACFRQCYTTCDYRRSHIDGWAGNCQNDCEEQCNRCNKYVWNRLKRDPRCPPPKCMLKTKLGRHAWRIRKFQEVILIVLSKYWRLKVSIRNIPTNYQETLDISMSVQDPRFKRRWMPIFSTSKNEP